jgi:hypothetical protein
MSRHFKLTIGLIALLSGLLFLSYRYLRQKLGGVPMRPPTILKTKDVQAIKVDSVHHTITIQTPTGTKTEYARNPVIHIQKNGVVTIDRNLLGLELQPFLGVGYSDTTRLFLGMNGLHMGRFDIHGELGGVPDDTKVLIRPYIGLGYNFWSNTSLNMSVNPLTIYTVPQVAVFVSVRL